MKKIIIHSVLWAGLGYLFFFLLSVLLPVKLALLRTFSAVLLMAAMFYFSGWLLANQLLIKRRKILLFSVLIVLSVFLFSVLRIKVFHWLPEEAVTLPTRFSAEDVVAPEKLLWKRNLLLLQRFDTGSAPFLSGLLLSSVLSIIAVLWRLYENKDQKERESREELQRSQEAQILYLKSQVNPHFLFNTLNNLYGLTYSKSELAPQMVLGLSDTMRYMIYETEQKLVHLEKELNFIRNYLELEKMRISNPENIRVSEWVRNLSVFVPPLLLLPFIENCFKHGSIGKDDDGWMEIDIWDEEDSLFFVCKNNFNENRPVKSSGIGLTNVQKRLQLIFGERYKLKTLEQNNEFMVSLQFPVFQRKDML